MSPEGAGAFLEALDEPAFLVDRRGAIAQANGAALRFLSMTAGALDGRSLIELAGDRHEAVRLMLQQAASSSGSVVAALSLGAAGGGPPEQLWRGSRLGAPETAEPMLLVRRATAPRESAGSPGEEIAALEDEIGRGEQARRRLEAALAEKETMLRELHHRAKNILQTLLGILSIAESRTGSPVARAAIQDARLRVEVLAVLERLLERRDGREGVEAFALLHDVCESVQRSLGRPEIRLEVAPGQIFVGQHVASALGLIVNELVTNAYKHAFPDRAAGRILVRLSPIGDSRLVLEVEDDGCGLGAERASGTGLTLVRGVVQQCGGSCEMATGRGLRSTVTLPAGSAPALSGAA
jgi:two-component sensor histidine kinase